MQRWEKEEEEEEDDRLNVEMYLPFSKSEYEYDDIWLLHVCCFFLSRRHPPTLSLSLTRSDTRL
jgi:hypothetical protein